MSDQDDVLRVIREMKAIGGRAKPKATELANRLSWATHGCDKRLNDALQALRRSGTISFMKGIGWVEIAMGE
jgi:hypothetical protein